MSITIYFHHILWAIAVALGLFGALTRDHGDYDFVTAFVKLGAFILAAVLALWGLREWWIA